jgi:hypothetical protein
MPSEIVCPLVVVLIILAIIGITISSCGEFPYRACRVCKGGGKLTNPFWRKSWKNCPKCKGTGKKIRLGRRIYEHVTGAPRMEI